MTEDQYKRLCRTCDNVLLEGKNRPERLAVSWLHVMREHPAFLSQYSIVYDLEKRCSLFGKVISFFLNFLLHIKHFAACIIRGHRSWYSANFRQAPFDILFISHIINAAHAGREDDFYFGSLPKELAKRGYKVGIALINHSGEKAKKLARAWHAQSIPRFIFSSTLDLLSEYRLFARQRRESHRIKRFARDKYDAFHGKILLHAIREATLPSSLFTIRLYEQVSRLVSQYHPGFVCTTFEGHAWERLVFLAAHMNTPSSKCIAYQHAALFRLQHAIRRTLSVETSPDIIFTAGGVSARQLSRTSSFSGLPIHILGSNRASRPLPSSQVRRRTSGFPACLVLPEGIPSECNVLFSFSLRCASMCPDLLFVWRLHPVVSWQSLLLGNSMYSRLPDNVRLSTSTFEEDMAACSMALYRGTTAIVQAIMAGLHPIYVSLPDEMTIDPLYELGQCRSCVSDPEEFRQIIATLGTQDTAARTESQTTAQKYCQEFFTPLNVSIFESVLQ